MIRIQQITNLISKIIGNELWAKFQAKIKFYQSFMHCYSKNFTKVHPKGKTVIYMADGKTSHGGLSDRLRGIFSLYQICKEKSYNFKIYFIHPFDLSLFLIPNKENWLINKEDISNNKSETSFVFINSYSNIDNRIFRNLIEVDEGKQLHVYSNYTFKDESTFKADFNNLFKFSPLLEQSIMPYLKEITNSFEEKYISISFRFISLLGDFKDSSFAKELETNEEKELYIQKSIEIIDTLHKKYPQYKRILVTSDSNVFMNRLKNKEYVYLIPGNIIHLDYVSSNIEGHLKTFVDFIMVSKAEKIYCFHYGKMYKSTRFAKTAAAIGDKEFIMLTGDDIEK